MLGTQIAKISCPVFAGLAIITAGIIIYAVVSGHEIEVKSPFLGEWKIKPCRNTR